MGVYICSPLWSEFVLCVASIVFGKITWGLKVQLNTLKQYLMPCSDASAHSTPFFLTGVPIIVYVFPDPVWP